VALVIRTALTREDELLAAMLQEINGRLDMQNMARDAFTGDMFGAGTIDGSKLVPDSVGQTELETLVDLNKPVVAALPGSPVDGQVVYYQSSAMATAGVVWAFKYRAGSASTYKWEFIGGRSLRNEVATDQSTGSTTYTDLATNGPDVTTPLAGDYRLRWGFYGYSNGAVSLFMSPASSDNISAVWSPTTNLVASSPMMTVDRLAVAANTLYRAKYRSSNGVLCNFQQRWIELEPVRVG
jgi:hypothetical protein